MSVYVNVTDPQATAPNPWPGVFGSTIELFFDLRDVREGFGSGYGDGVYQVLLKPALSKGESVEIWNVRSERGILKNAEVQGAPNDGGYWGSYFVPRASLGRTYEDPRPIGFHVGVDGPDLESGKRKSQLMLFGTSSNSKDASNCGVLLPPSK